MKYLLDANLPPSLAASLRALGFEATHVQDFGAEACEDEAVLRLAQEQGAALVVQDAEFPHLLPREPRLGAVVLLDGAPDEPSELATLLAGMPESVIEALTEGAIVSIGADRWQGGYRAALHRRFRLKGD